MILYFGNMLSQHGYTPTALELLIPHLKKKYEVISSSSLKNPIFRMFHMIYCFFKYKKQTKLVLVDTYSTWAFYYALIICVLSKLFSKPYMPILHGGDLKKRLQINPQLSHYLFSNAFINVSPSLYLHSIFKDNGFNVLYIPNFIDVSQYSYLKRKNTKPKLLWVRSLHRIYNPCMAIRVLHELKKTNEEAELCMVGPFKDNSVKEVKLLAEKLSVAKSLKITGMLTKPQWIELSKEYDIFINTTNFDNIPVTLLESMALGLPIVSTDVGGIPNLLTHNFTAKLVKPNDILGMVSNIYDYLSDDKKRLEISSNARNMIENNFNREIVIKQWHHLIDKIVL